MKKPKSYYSTKSPNHQLVYVMVRELLIIADLVWVLVPRTINVFPTTWSPKGNIMFVPVMKQFVIFARMSILTQTWIILLREPARILPLSIIKSNRRIIDVINYY